MHIKNLLKLSLVLVYIMSFTLTCSLANRYGKLRLSSTSEAGISIEQLNENYEDYQIFYAGVSLENPSAILFDPKKDNRSLIPDRWIRVEKKGDLEELISWLMTGVKYPPSLYVIMDRQNRTFGYFYSPWTHVYTKIVDENTIWVDDLPLPPLDSGETRGSGV